MHLALGLATALAMGSLVWIIPLWPRRWLVLSTAVGLGIVIGGTALGWPLYPLSDIVILGLGLSGGVLLGRVFPSRLSAFFVFLLALTILDVAQNLAFSGSPGPSTAGGAPDPHLIWLNFRIPLPSGHFNIGFADLIVIAAMTQHVRRNGATFVVSVLPGAAGLLVGELVLALHQPQGAFPSAVLASLVPFLLVGWLLAVAVLKIPARADEHVSRFRWGPL